MWAFKYHTQIADRTSISHLRQQNHHSQMVLVRVKSLLSPWQQFSFLFWCSVGPVNRAQPPCRRCQAPGLHDRFNMLAAMLRQSSGGGSNSSSGGPKLPLGITRLSSSSFGNWVPGRDSKSCSVSTDGSDIPASDPNYIMQLVSDVRKFADVLLQLKEVFNSKGILLMTFC